MNHCSALSAMPPPEPILLVVWMERVFQGCQSTGVTLKLLFSSLDVWVEKRIASGSKIWGQGRLKTFHADILDVHAKHLQAAFARVDDNAKY